MKVYKSICLPRNSARTSFAANRLLASVQNATSLADLKLKGWTDAETTAFQTARTAFGPAEQFRVQSTSGAKDTTTTKNTDAATLYENVLTIQNAADLQFPASNADQRDGQWSDVVSIPVAG